jgi:hypothetical protein
LWRSGTGAACRATRRRLANRTPARNAASPRDAAQEPESVSVREAALYPGESAGLSEAVNQIGLAP